MPSEWKFVVHSWIFKVHSKKSDCILRAFQIFGPILVTGPNVFIMLKTFEEHLKWKNIERHLNCTLTAFYEYSYVPLRHSNSIRNILIAFEGESKRQAIFKSCQNVPNAPWMSRNAPRMHFDSAGIAIQMSSEYFDCRSNAARIPDVIQNTAESHI